jgi:hypothetical protein
VQPLYKEREELMRRIQKDDIESDEKFNMLNKIG